MLAVLSSQQIGSHPFALSTLQWVLHSRELSPLVHLHYTFANEALKTFLVKHASISDLDSSFKDLHVFAVMVDPTERKATLLRQASEIQQCESCPSIESSNVREHLSSSAAISGEIQMSEKCDSRSRSMLVVYASLHADQFPSWLRELDAVSRKCEYNVLLRFWHPSRLFNNGTQTGASLQGFTVQATLKNTEYNVIDDRVFSTKLFYNCPYGEVTCSASSPKVKRDVFEWPDRGSDATKEYTGLQAFQFLAGGADFDHALERLQLFTEDAPSVLRSEMFERDSSLDKTEGKHVVQAVRHFREKIGENDLLFINDQFFDLQSLTQGMSPLFRCLSVISTSQMKISMLPKSKMESKSHSSLETPSSNNRLRVNLSIPRKLRSSLVAVNDLLQDSRYKKWNPLNLQNKEDVKRFRTEVQRASSQSVSDDNHLSLVKVKAHHLRLTVLLDPGSLQQFLYTQIPQSVVHADLPIQVNMVLIPNGQASSLITAAFHYFLRVKGRKTSFRFLQMIEQILQYMGSGYQQTEISEQVVELAFQQIAQKIESSYASAREIMNRDKEVIAILQEARVFAEENGLFTKVSSSEVHPHGRESKIVSMLGIFNGIVLKDISADVIRTALAEQKRISAFMSSAFSKREITDSEIGGWVEEDSSLIVIESLSRNMKAGNERVSQVESSEEPIQISGNTLLTLKHELRNLQYLGSPSTAGAEADIAITVWLAASDYSSNLSESAHSLMVQLSKSTLAVKTRARFALLDPHLQLHREALRPVKHVKGISDVVFVINGRTVPYSETFSVKDLQAEIASEYVTAPTSKGSADDELIRLLLSKDVAQVCSSAQYTHAGMKQVNFGDFVNAILSSNFSKYVLSSKGDQDLRGDAALRISAVVNPIGKRPYILSSLLKAMRELYRNTDMIMTVVIAPLEMQMQSKHQVSSTYSKYVVGMPTTADFANRKLGRTTALFHRLPAKEVLTFAVTPPRPWFVSSFSTNYDMDNILLERATKETRRLHAEYEVKSLIVEGSCVDEDGRPPQGLKLILENNNGVSVDTTVMENLGYFQLKVPYPGRWFLKLAPGPSTAVFSLRNMEMFSGMKKSTYTVESSKRVPILVASLSGAGGILLRVERNPGMDKMSVLDPNRTQEDSKSITKRLKSSLNSLYKSKKIQSLQRQNRSVDMDTINVFSVASGHLYERFLKIMMSSVTKHASRPVKFWLLENYLSPSFKKMLPLFAEKLGCDVGMVTYKWPGWLRGQTEKQRIIWAYKILFLDVLFPLDVSRIIFVDSDQVVRGDLAELMDINLQGAPYGYVPFCDSRKEVEGYRFWKQGFWKDTLRGAKYRISALYVVDLVRFREMAAGDTLRSIYQSLSADPNSLSNLDQDLPNYASVSSFGAGKSVPIFDLPGEWLWCESWCDDESKKNAKTIDLCNNPMTKEPKLESAKRIIDEWQEYDDAATHSTEEIYRLIADGVEALNIPGFRSGKCAAKESCMSSPNPMKDEL